MFNYHRARFFGENDVLNKKYFETFKGYNDKTIIPTNLDLLFNYNKEERQFYTQNENILASSYLLNIVDNNLINKKYRKNLLNFDGYLNAHLNNVENDGVDGLGYTRFSIY